jgi:hypothetical protein
LDHVDDDRALGMIKKVDSVDHFGESGCQQHCQDPLICSSVCTHMHPALQRSYSVPYEVEPR